MNLEKSEKEVYAFLGQKIFGKISVVGSGKIWARVVYAFLTRIFLEKSVWLDLEKSGQELCMLFLTRIFLEKSVWKNLGKSCVCISCLEDFWKNQCG